MVNISKNALVPYQAVDMLALVNDIESYPEFLNWCESGELISEDKQCYEAGLSISIKGIKINFITHNCEKTSKNNDQSVIQLNMSLLKGPFKELNGVWEFSQLGDFGSKIELSLSYQLRSSIVGQIFAKGFDKIAQRMVSDFVERAGVLYAKN